MSHRSTFDLDLAADHLTELVSRAEQGDEVILARADRPVAKIVAYQDAIPRQLGRRIFGQYRGEIEIADSFDDPLPEGWWTGPIE